MAEQHREEIAENSYSSILQNLIIYIPLGLTIVGFISCLVIELSGIAIIKEVREQSYSVIGTVGHCLALIANIAYGRRYRLNWIKSIVFSYLSFELIFAVLSGVWTDVDIALFGTGIIASYRSIMFLPLLCVILAVISKENTWELCDFLTPWFFFKHGFVTLACWIEGCCAGRPWPWGLVSPLTGNTVFPTQPCIIIVSVAVAYWGLYYAKKHVYQAKGLVFADSIIIYGFFRYLIELFTNNPRVWWTMSCLSFCSLAMVAQGLLVRHIAEKHQKTP